ncbi:MAG: hypothetical protein FWD75_06255 [Propionibacteriaceae bacterium]|nr:hypothetical protein [Propionibacteriaceae bacterium]
MPERRRFPGAAVALVLVAVCVLAGTACWVVVRDVVGRRGLVGDDLTRWTIVAAGGVSLVLLVVALVVARWSRPRPVAAVDNAGVEQDLDPPYPDQNAQAAPDHQPVVPADEARGYAWMRAADLANPEK